MFTVKWKIAFWWELLQVCTDLQNNICSLTLSNFQFQLKWNLTGILFGGKKVHFMTCTSVIPTIVTFQKLWQFGLDQPAQ